METTQEQIQQLNGHFIDSILAGTYEIEPNKNGQTIKVIVEEEYSFTFYLNKYKGQVDYLPTAGAIGLGFTESERKQLYQDFKTKIEYQEYLRLKAKFEGTEVETAPEQPVEDSTTTETEDPTA